jgi:hypothetical protein
VGPPLLLLPPSFCSRPQAERRGRRGGLPPPATLPRTESGYTASLRADPHKASLLPPPLNPPLLTRNATAGGETRLSHGGRRRQGHGSPHWTAREHHQLSLNKPQPQPRLETAGAHGSTAAPDGRSLTMVAARVPAVPDMEQALHQLDYDLHFALVPLGYPKRTHGAGRRLPTGAGRRRRSEPKRNTKIR